MPVIIHALSLGRQERPLRQGPHHGQPQGGTGGRMTLSLHSSPLQRARPASSWPSPWPVTSSATADETCQSPYLAKITGQEDFVYVWTLGIEGVGDGSDKLVTVDVRPGSKTFGKVISSASVGGRHEAHHGGFTDDRRQLWLAGLDTSMIFVFDIYTNPSKPRLVKTIDTFVRRLRRCSWAARYLCVAGPRADLGTLQQPGQARSDGPRRVHQRRALHHHPLDADG